MLIYIDLLLVLIFLNIFDSFTFLFLCYFPWISFAFCFVLFCFLGNFLRSLVSYEWLSTCHEMFLTNSFGVPADSSP